MSAKARNSNSQIKRRKSSNSGPTSKPSRPNSPVPKTNRSTSSTTDRPSPPVCPITATSWLERSRTSSLGTSRWPATTWPGGSGGTVTGCRSSTRSIRSSGLIAERMFLKWGLVIIMRSAGVLWLGMWKSGRRLLPGPGGGSISRTIIRRWTWSLWRVFGGFSPSFSKRVLFTEVSRFAFCSIFWEMVIALYCFYQCIISCTF